ncbi:hypothetical protein N0V83_001617 [Neocucurbitaria cava]|uniref:Transcription factor domain-containing protein n=1 Tax=Neocucurbitaria cava TaxID=798079 RepID=A0A9W8YHI0_9PLEO|nr:hypothetical protein N0V83_001617 [Neocucurbitaria cava]
MKCRLTQDLIKCHRCTRKSLDCVFQQHRRGRKLGTRLNPQCSSKSDRPAHVESTTEPGHAQSQDEFGLTAERQPDEPESVTRDFWADNDGFQPPSLLNRHAAKGNFSLQNVLSTNAEPRFVTAGSSSSARTEDPIATGLLNYAIATSLFERFMENLNPFICQFDPVLHTFDYVRETSPFLFSAVLAAAAKALNPSLYTPLRDHAETLFARAFRRGDKSPEVVQAILVLTYWKEPEDTRAFVNVGLAIRIAMELGWNKSVVHGQTSGSNVLEARKARNIQRTWLVMFVYDRRALPPILNSILWHTHTVTFVFASFAVVSLSEIGFDRHGSFMDQLQRGNQNAAPIFLIKLLLSVPKAIRREIETTTLQTLRTTALIFSQQAAPANCGCALQSMFLANIVALVEKACQRRIVSSTFEHALRPCPEQHPEQREAEPSTNQVTGAHDRCVDRVQDQNMQSSHDHGIEVEAVNDLSITPQSQDFNFFDNEMWSSMFANAGFSINDGIFLPDVDG